MQKLAKQDDTALRNRVNYEEDLNLDTLELGITERSIFNECYRKL